MLLAIACTAMLALVSRLGSATAGDVQSAVALLAVAVATISGFVRIERDAANPDHAARAAVKRAIGPSMIASCLLGVGFLSLDTYVPLYVQGAKGGGARRRRASSRRSCSPGRCSGIFAAPLVVRLGFRKTATARLHSDRLSFIGLLVCAIVTRRAGC